MTSRKKESKGETMRALVQRVTEASVSVKGHEVGRIGHGLLVLLGVRRGDRDEDVEWLARKVVGLRIFDDAEGRFDRSVADIGGAVLVISQFTLYGDARKGRRPNFGAAADPTDAEAHYKAFIRAVGDLGVPVESGRFGAHMAVASVNDGPVTLMLQRGDG